MPLSPLEAANRGNEQVTVEMLVKAAKNCPHCSQIFLDSEEDHHEPNNLAGLGGVTEDRSQVRDVGSLRPFLKPFDHAGLDVDAHDLATGQHSLCGRNQQSSRASANLQDPLPWPKSHPLERHFRSGEAFVERLVQYPSEKSRTWQRPDPASPAPPQEAEQHHPNGGKHDPGCGCRNHGLPTSGYHRQELACSGPAPCTPCTPLIPPARSGLPIASAGSTTNRKGQQE